MGISTLAPGNAPLRQIGYAEFVVRIPLLEGDKIRGGKPGNWFEYKEPGIAKGGKLGVCSRKVEQVGETKVVLDEGESIMA